jgi:hypothetical protein
MPVVSIIVIGNSVRAMSVKLVLSHHLNSNALLTGTAAVTTGNSVPYHRVRLSKKLDVFSHLALIFWVRLKTVFHDLPRRIDFPGTNNCFRGYRIIWTEIASNYIHPTIWVFLSL